MLAKLRGQKPLWVFPEEDNDWLEKIMKEFNIHHVTAQILMSRGFKTLEDINNYLYAKLPKLYSPGLFHDMDKAVKRIIKAIQNKEAILIYGDNDVDGMTAASLLTEFFRQLRVNVFFYIQSSATQKKDIISDALQYALKHNCSLIITVDCGITAAKAIEHVDKHDVDVIITDHHEPTSKIPHCVATLNPKLFNSTYPNRDITGVGVAFKLAHAVTNYLIENGDIKSTIIDLKKFLDLVALGTISDMGALLDENRIFVRYGLKQLRKTKRMGLMKLFHICEINYPQLTTIDIASKIAPRLNSLGRIADPRKGVELLLVRNENAASRLAQELDIYNLERQKIERQASENIDNYIKTHPEILANKAIVLYSDKWHPGIIPIITARISKHYNRPCMLIAIENGIGKGSMRTIPEFPLLHVLKENEGILINFGGHDFAAGLTIREENIPIIKKSFINAANAKLKDPDVISKLYLDSKVNFSDLTFDFMESLCLLEPYGNENPPPLLYCDARQVWFPKIVGKSHLKLYLEQDDRMLEGIGFGMAQKRSLLKRKNIQLRVAFTPYINTFLNKSSIQLQIRDFQVLENINYQLQ
jgi:single-stranded-DNA-specific exonuclease